MLPLRNDIFRVVTISLLNDSHYAPEYVKNFEDVKNYYLPIINELVEKAKSLRLESVKSRVFVELTNCEKHKICNSIKDVDKAYEDLIQYVNKQKSKLRDIQEIEKELADIKEEIYKYKTVVNIIDVTMKPYIDQVNILNK